MNDGSHGGTRDPLHAKVKSCFTQSTLALATERSPGGSPIPRVCPFPNRYLDQLSSLAKRILQN